MANISRRIIQYVNNEIPDGIINGKNKEFYLESVPVEGTETVKLMV